MKMMKRLTLITLAAITTLSLQAKEPSDLELAYQKEFTFLKAQKRSLQKRLQSIQVEQKANLAKAKRHVETLQGKLLHLNTRSDMIAQKVAQAERDEQDVTDDNSVLEGTVMQAAATLKPLGLSMRTDSKHAIKELKRAFAFAAQKIESLSTITHSKGSFFLKNGTKVEGDIVNVGNIARFGYSNGTATALVPAGNGAFKAWDNPAHDTAVALKEGKAKESLGLFIYESSVKEIQSAQKKSALDVINSGGAIGWVIVVLGLVALLLIVLRIIFLKRADSNNEEIVGKVAGAMLEKDAKKALKVCKERKGATARVLAATIRNIDKDREHLEDIVSESVLHESSYLDRFGSAVMVIAAVAPLLGLLGTVTGMISTFDVITEFGTGDPKLLSGGISEALVTTELGLIVAIPALLVGNLLSGWAERIKDHMEQAALHVNNVYLSQSKS